MGKKGISAQARAQESLHKLEKIVEPKAELVKQSVCNFSFFVLIFKGLVLILFFYTFSIGLTFYNKKFISSFRFPLSITMVHLVTKFVLSGIVRSLIECKTKVERVNIPWSEYIKRLAPAGIASALDIGMSNWSFEFITISLYTMTKSTSIIFILFFALIFKLEQCRLSLVFVVLFIAVGLFLFTYQSTQFNLEGFVLVLIASILAGMRWTLAQAVTQKNELGLGNPVDMMYHIQPWMIVGLLPLSVGVEGVDFAASSHTFGYKEPMLMLQTAGLLFAGACIAFCLEFSEYLLLSQTSSLTLSIAGIFKEVCTLYLAAQINGDTMSGINAVGLIVCLLGIALHIILKAVYRKEAKSKPKDNSMEMLLVNGNANLTDEDDDEIELYISRKR